MTDTDRLGYPLKPRQLRKNGGEAWFYETPKGILVVGELRPNGVYQGTTQVLMPWVRISGAVENHQAIQQRRKKPRARPRHT